MNAMRFLEQKKIPYAGHFYADTDAASGVEVTRALGENPVRVLKALATMRRSRQYYVLMIPVAAELDLKKAAKAAGEKSTEMIKAKELLPLAGYTHGGCFSIGMKKSSKATVDSSATGSETIIFSADRIRYQAEVSPGDLKKVVRYELSKLTVNAGT